MVVALLHVFLKVLSEVEQGFLYLTLKLVMKTKEEMAMMRSGQYFLALLLSRAQDREEMMPQPKATSNSNASCPHESSE